jgi:WD40 repeat protein
MKQRFKMAKHSSYIKHFDFTKDGNYLHSTSGDYELLFWDSNTGKQVTSGATLTRDYEWATWNVTLGWPVQGIWEAFTDGTDINAIDCSKRTYGSGMNIAVTGNDSG